MAMTTMKRDRKLFTDDCMTTMKRDRKLFTDDCTTTIEYPPHTTTYRDPVEAFVAGVIKGALAVIDDAFGGDSPPVSYTHLTLPTMPDV